VGNPRFSSLHLAIAFLRSAGAVLEAIWKGSQPHAATVARSFPPVRQTDHPLITFQGILRRHDANRSNFPRHASCTPPRIRA
jgi:hypothetical protein